MISFGKNIKQPADVLNKLPLKIVADKIMNPNPSLAGFINQLRTVATIDPNKYRSLKVQLPYFVAAIFNPPYRKIENFAYTEYFILDIDHLNEKEISTNSLMDKLKGDNRIVLSFRSPSNEGVKIFFKLSEKCYDSGKYKLFYQAFAQKFSLEYNLNQYIDKRTSDVSRACFYSYDTDAYYNPQADTIRMASIINFDNELEIREVEQDIKAHAKSIDPLAENGNMKQVLPDKLLQQIRETLNPNIKIKREKKVYVPQELETILGGIKNEMDKYSIVTEQVTNINYGKQLKFVMANQWAEINLFYGKKGYSVVKTTKSGSNEELADVVHKIICQLIYG